MTCFKNPPPPREGYKRSLFTDSFISVINTFHPRTSIMATVKEHTSRRRATRNASPAPLTPKHFNKISRKIMGMVSRQATVSSTRRDATVTAPPASPSPPPTPSRRRPPSRRQHSQDEREEALNTAIQMLIMTFFQCMDDKIESSVFRALETDHVLRRLRLDCPGDVDEDYGDGTEDEEEQMTLGDESLSSTPRPPSPPLSKRPKLRNKRSHSQTRHPPLKSILKKQKNDRPASATTTPQERPNNEKTDPMPPPEPRRFPDQEEDEVDDGVMRSVRDAALDYSPPAKRDRSMPDTQDFFGLM